MLFKHLYPYSRFFHAPDDDAGGGGGGPDDPPSPPKTYSEDEFNSHSKKQRERYERELKKKEKERQALQERFDKLEEQFKQFSGGADDPPPMPPTPTGNNGPTTYSGQPGGNLAEEQLRGALELERKKRERELAELSGQVDSLKAAAEGERKKRLEVERNRLLDEALRAAGVADKAFDVARDHFVKKITHDELSDDPEAWYYRTKEEGIVSIAEGVSEEMPDFLRAPATTKTGSGMPNGSTPEGRKLSLATKLEKAEQELQELFNKGRQSGADEDIFAYSRKEQEVKALRQQLQASSA